MTDQTLAPAAPVENVGRGATFALLAIPAAIVIFIIVGGVFKFSFAGIASIVVPYIAYALYTRGAGTQLTRKGWGPFIGVAAIAVVVGTFTGIVALAYALYLGNDSLLSTVFLRSVGNRIASGDGALSIIVGLGLGAVGIVGAIRGQRTNRVVPAAPATPDASAPVAPVAPPVAPPVPPAANQPSPGVLLNGKPINPKQK